MSDRQKKYFNFLLVLCILLITAAIYFKSVHFDFINWDDDRQVYENADIRSLSIESVKKIFSTYYLKMYQPLTTLSYALEYKINGADPGIYHLHNLILHLINCLLVFIFVFMLIRHSLASALVAFLFALHPMHVESVAWVTERKDVLYTFFYFLSLIAYIIYIRKNRNVFWLIGSILFFICSLLSKSAAITLPLILFLIDFKEARPLKLSTLPDKIPFLLLAILFGILSVISQKVFDPAIEITQQFHFYERFLLGSYAFFFYIIKLIIPAGLSAMHPFPLRTSNLLPVSYFIAFIGLVMFGVYLTWSLVKKKYTNERSRSILFGILFFCFTIGLVIFVPVGSAFAAERYTYIPYIGLFISLSCLIVCKHSPDHELQIKDHNSTDHDNQKYKIKNYVLYSVIIFWLIFLTFTTYYRLDVWKNSLVFWDDVIRKNPKNAPMAYNNRGVTKYLQGNYAGAIPDFTMAIHQHPKFIDAYHYRGLSRVSIHDYTNAICDFDTTLMIKPTHVDALINRGQAKANSGNIEASISDFSVAISINPLDYLPHYNRGILYALQGKNDLAYTDLSTAVRLNRTFAAAWYARGMVALNTGNKQQACDDLKKAADLGNESANKAWISNCR
jgi:Tfp pilus assembly protein PilF